MTAKTNTAESDKPITKTGFIRSFGPDVSANEIVAKGKEAGLDFEKKYVWTLQSEMRNGTGGTGKKSKRSAKKMGKKAATVASPVAAHASVADPSAKKKYGFKKGTGKVVTKVATAATKPAGRSSAEHELKALIVELGTARAEGIYRAVRTRLSMIVGQA